MSIIFFTHKVSAVFDILRGLCKFSGWKYDREGSFFYAKS